MMGEHPTPVALRFWPVPEQESATPISSGPARRRGRSSPIGRRVLVLDTETTVDEFQALRFGFFRVYANGRLDTEGVFVADALPQDDPASWAAISTYAATRGLALMTRAEFVREVFYREAWSLGALVVGFNLPFDLSRLALHAGAGRGRDRGSFSFKLSESLFHARLRVKPLSAHAALFEFVRPKRSQFGARRRFSGRFLDLHTLAYALSGSSYSLRSAGEAFGAQILKEAVPGGEEAHGGPITEDYLGYARRDVAATYSLYLALLRAYSEMPFSTDGPECDRSAGDTPITELYSSASIAKACLRKMGVPGFRKRLEAVPPEYLGYAMAAYYGGRIECRVRHLRVDAALLDFRSQYPAVFTLLDLWPQVIAERLEIEEGQTEAVSALLQTIADDPDCLFRPEHWPQLAGFAQVLPDGDFLPSRAPWGCSDGRDLSKVTLSVAPLVSREPMWYALPDLAASAAVTGKAPKLLRVFRCVSRGRLRLSPLTLGETTFDPKSPDFFARVVAERKRLENLGDLAAAFGVKALANSGCYGIFLEFNPQHLKDKELRRWVTLYAETTERKAFAEKVELPGPFANPLLGSLVTAGGRLLLAMLQRETEGRDGAFVWTATDAMAVVTGDGAAVESLPGIRSLSSGEVAAIQGRFQALSPYGEAVTPFLKLEATGTAYAISSNRYCLTTADGRLFPSVDDGEDVEEPKETGEGWKRVSMHGMSGIIPPAGERLPDFSQTVWLAVLRDQVPPGWDRELLRRQFPIRRPSTWRQANKALGSDGYERSIKPFGWLQTVSSDKLLGRIGNDGLSYYGPFTRDGRSALKKKWWDPRSGRRVRITPRPFDLGMVSPDPSLIYCGTLADFVQEFRSHRDVKMMPADGGESFGLTAGRFVPRPVHRVGAYPIGKETNRIVTAGSTAADCDGERAAVTGKARVLTPAQLADIRKLERYPAAAVADALGKSASQWRRTRSGQCLPDQGLWKVVRSLARALPAELPAGYEAQCAAVVQARNGRSIVSSENSGSVRLSAADELMSLIPDLGIDVFRDAADRAWCRLPGNEAEEVHPLGGERVRSYLSARFYEAKRRVLPANAIKVVLSTLAGTARVEAEMPEKDHPIPAFAETAEAQPNTVSSARPSAATELVRLIPDLGIDLFRTSAGQVWCQVPINGHQETHPLEGEWMSGYLADAFYRHQQRVMPSGALPAALPILKHHALSSTDEREVCVRVGGSVEAGRIYIDLGNEAWEAVEIDADGWRVVTNPPVPFYRPNGMLALPRPVLGSIEALRPLLNYGTEANFKQIVAFLVGALRPSGPFPVLSLQGGEGSGKSSLERYLVRLIDPQTGALRKSPGRDPSFSVFVAAKSGWLQAYDNLSSLSGELSDDLCRLATGGGHVKRALYTDDDLRRYEAVRPVILTSITNVIYRPDLRERAMLVCLEKPPQVMEEAGLNARFERDQAAILGALYAAVSTALRRWADVPTEGRIRLADFARWVEAAAPVFGWQPGEFSTLLRETQGEAKLEAVSEEPFAQALLGLLEGQNGTWNGVARELLEAVNEAADDLARRSKGWPQKPADVASYLARMTTELKHLGLSVVKGERTRHGVTYSITLAETPHGEPDRTAETTSGDEPERRCGRCAAWLPERLLTRVDVGGGYVSWQCAACLSQVVSP